MPESNATSLSKGPEGPYDHLFHSGMSKKARIARVCEEIENLLEEGEHLAYEATLVFTEIRELGQLLHEMRKRQK